MSTKVPTQDQIDRLSEFFDVTMPPNRFKEKRQELADLVEAGYVSENGPLGSYYYMLTVKGAIALDSARSQGMEGVGSE